MDLIVINSDSAFKSSKNYYLPTLLEELKYKIKGKKIRLFVTDDVKSSSDDEFEREHFEENSD